MEHETPERSVQRGTDPTAAERATRQVFAVGKAGDPPPLTASLRNIGGLTEAEVGIEPGVTLLVGENATNRSSTLRGIAAALGADVPAEGLLRTDADDGRVVLRREAAATGSDSDDREAGAPAVGVELERGTGRQVRQTRMHGRVDPWTRSAVTNFVALFEDNPIRAAIGRGDTGSLYRHLMAPVDTDALEAKIEEVRSEREEVTERIETLEHEKADLPEIEAELRRTEEALEETEADLAAAEQRVDELEASRPETDEAEALFARLESKREELQARRHELRRERDAIESLEERRAEIDGELEGFELPNLEAEEIDRRLTELQSRRSGIRDTVGELKRVLRFNRKVLETDEYEAFSDGDVTAALDPEGADVNCWTCGSTVAQSAIRERLSDLEELVERKENELQQLEGEIDEYRDKRSRLEDARERREELEDEQRTIEDELEQRRSRVPEIETHIADLEETIEEIEARIESARDDRNSALLNAYQRVAELRTELDQEEAERERITERLETREQRVEELDELRERETELTAQIERLRERVTDLERDIVERFNENMAAVVETLEYENLSRVWIERTVEANETDFVLHIVRRSDAVYEDTIETLSESEREVVGLMVAIAGYLAHGVAGELPILLLDSLEAIDADRIRDLVTFLADNAGVEYLVAALLPADAAAMPESVTRREATADLVPAETEK